MPGCAVYLVLHRIQEATDRTQIPMSSHSGLEDAFASVEVSHGCSITVASTPHCDPVSSCMCMDVWTKRYAWCLLSVTRRTPFLASLFPTGTPRCGEHLQSTGHVRRSAWYPLSAGRDALPNLIVSHKCPSPQGQPSAVKAWGKLQDQTVCMETLVHGSEDAPANFSASHGRPHHKGHR